MQNNNEIVKVEGNLIETFPVHFSHSEYKDRVEIIETNNGKVEYWHMTRAFTGFDQDIWVAISSLVKKHGETQKISVLPSDIISELGLSDSPNNKQLVKNSLDELSGTSVKYSGSWRGADGEYGVTGRFNLFSYRFVTKHDLKTKKELHGCKSAREASYIKLSDELYESLTKGGYYKYIDMGTYRQLPVGMARRAYLYIEKRMGKRHEYEEDFKGFISHITFTANVSANDKKHFKHRILPALSSLYCFTFKGEHIVVRKSAVQTFLPFTPRKRRAKLTEHGEYVLNRACEFAGREDDHFKNVIKKYIHLLGSEIVDGLIGECRDYNPDSKEKYFIHLLKSYGKDTTQIVDSGLQKGLDGLL